MPVPAQNRRRILFVDDDAAFLETMGELMGAMSDGQWEVLTAPSASQAFAALQAQPVDLAILDVQMPVMDGIQMLSMLNRRYPNVQKVVLTGFANEKYRAACLSNGAELFLEKPKSREELQGMYATLSELMKPPSAPGFWGVLRPVELQEVIQMECVEKHSSVLEIKSDATDGRIYIQAGALVHAQAGERKGPEALRALFTVSGGKFQLLPFEEPAERTLTGSWEALLLRATEVAPAAPSPRPAKVASPIPPAPASRVAAPRAAAVTLPTTGRPQIEELLICSAQGDVLHQWQCHDPDIWVKFLEFISQKSQRLAQNVPAGDFNRLEIHSDAARIVILIAPDRGVMLRTKRTAAATGAAPQTGRRFGTDAVTKERIAQWLRATRSARGVLLRGIRFADQTIVGDADSRDLPMSALEQALRIADNAWQVLKAQQLTPTRLMWVYSRLALHCVRRYDSAMLGAFVSAEPEATDLSLLDRHMTEFCRLEAKQG